MNPGPPGWGFVVGPAPPHIKNHLAKTSSTRKSKKRWTDNLRTTKACYKDKKGNV
jgi:hypothetical protein